MTTVAIMLDQKQSCTWWACDSQGSSDYEKDLNFQKHHKLKGGRVILGVGDSCYINLIKTHKDIPTLPSLLSILGDIQLKVGEDKDSGIVFLNKHDVYTIDTIHMVYHHRMDNLVTIGSGSSFFSGAYEALGGDSAEDKRALMIKCMKVACDKDLFSGGKIVVGRVKW